MYHICLSTSLQHACHRKIGIMCAPYGQDENHSCPAYTYTSDQWERAILSTDPNEGLNGGVNPLKTYCREFFTSSKANGLYDGPGAWSLGGQVYDCRKRSWYSNVKATMRRGWVGYVDRSTNEPAFAVCFPLSNLTTPGHLADENGLVGVSCAGVRDCMRACFGFSLLALHSCSIKSPANANRTRFTSAPSRPSCMPW